MFVIEKSQKGTASLPAKEIKAKHARAISSPLARQILKELSKKPSHPRGIAKKLKVNEQKVYYHIRNLEKAGITEILKSEIIQGTSANIYRLAKPAFVVKFKKFEATHKIAEIEDRAKKFLEPFIEEGQLNATIIAGSPDPHGPEMARSRDGYYGIDLALFLGSFLNYVPKLNVMLDTEARSEDLQSNLILVGGPVVNIITQKINSQLPVRFAKQKNWAIKSEVTGKIYHQEEAGIIVKTKNPFNPRKKILLVAGKRYTGTRAVMIAMLQKFKEIIKGNRHNSKIQANIIEGLDLDADGIVDDVRILE